MWGGSVGKIAEKTVWRSVFLLILLQAAFSAILPTGVKYFIFTSFRRVYPRQ